MESRQAPLGSLLLGGIAVGASLMYLFDPLRGRRRRAVARDKALHTARAGRTALGRASRDVAHRGHGLFAKVGARVWTDGDDAEDRVLEDRVRSKMGHFVSHPHAIEVLADDGEVTLSGEILESEVERLIATVRSVRGVRKVDDQLRVHESAEGISSLQGGSPRTRASRTWPPAKRLLATTAGGALALVGLRRGDKLGIALSTAGLALIARGMTAAPATIDVHKTIRVDAPIEDVFGYWAEFENFPRFMANVLEVRRTSSNCWHWVVRGPAGTKLEWDAELTVFEPERVLAWKSLPGATVGNAGSVHFAPEGENDTRVDVHVSYHPPAGAVGHGVAALLGRDPRAEMDEDLLRFKSLIEDGKTRVKGETVLRSDIPAGPVEPVHF